MVKKREQMLGMNLFLCYNYPKFEVEFKEFRYMVTDQKGNWNVQILSKLLQTSTIKFDNFKRHSHCIYLCVILVGFYHLIC